MSAIIFNGKEFAREKEQELLGKLGKTLKLVAILVGNNPESELYLRLKEKAAKELGIEFEWGKFDGENSGGIINFIEKKNNDSSVNGIIIELPLPKELVQFDLLDKLSPFKDVDCLTSENKKLLEEGKPRFIPPTVKAVGEVLEEGLGKLGESGKLGKKKIVVVGSEGTVGKGILSYLRNLSYLGDLRGVDKETKDLSFFTKNADILISATGVGRLIKKEMVKPGAVVIDVGIEKQKDGSLIGDVDFEQVKETASFITPVPGGIGPVTIVCLMENLIETVYH